MSGVTAKRSNTRLAMFNAASLAGLVGMHLAVVALLPPWATLVTAPVVGFAMAAMLSVVHETSHAVYVATRTANRVIGLVASLFIAMNFRLYRRDHMLHHKHFATDGDPEGTTWILSRWGLLGALLYNAHAVAHWRRSFAGVAGLFRPASDEARRIGWNGVLLAAFLLAMAAATVAAPMALVLGYWLPLALSLVFDNAISLPEHAHFGVRTGSEGPLTRSLQPGPLVRFLLYYVNYHREHHAEGGTSGAIWETLHAPTGERGDGSFCGRAFAELAGGH